MEEQEKPEVVPYKKEQYDDFIQMLEDGVPILSWKNLQEAYDVDDETLRSWRRTKKAQEAIKKNIAKSSQKMREVGREDWKMWDRHLKTLGVDTPEQLDLTTKGESIKPLYEDDGTHRFIEEFNKVLNKEADKDKFNKTN